MYTIRKPAAWKVIIARDGIQQGAYGIQVEVEEHPFPVDTMLFMDWRDNHLTSHPHLADLAASNRCEPSSALPIALIWVSWAYLA